MTMSAYLSNLRAKIGDDLLLVSTVAGVVFDERNRMLVAHHMDAGLWVLPGGHLDPGESPADGVVREVWEETGVLVEPTGVIGVFGGTPDFEWTYRNGDRVAFTMIAFECKPIGGAPRPDGEETSDVKYVTFEELRTLELVPCAYALIEGAHAFEGKTWFSPPEWRPA